MTIRTQKKLCQATLSNSVAAKYTTPANTKTQITEIWMANTNTTTIRKVSLFAHGTATNNTLVPSINIAPNGLEIIHGSKIVLSGGEIFAAKQDTGTDVVLTMYGVEEV